MKSIGFFNNKGGVGKTTLLCNLAASLSIHFSKKVLVIDADPQCNASAYLLPENMLEDILMNDTESSIDKFYEPIRKGQGFPENNPKIVRSDRFEIDLIVGNPKLAIREDFIATDWNDTKNGEARGFQTTFAMAELFSRMSDYDFILIDMGPSLGALNRSILLSSDYFLMPISADIFSMMAISNIQISFDGWKEDLINALERYNKREGKKFTISNDIPFEWKLDFLGYVRQQYKAKYSGGERQPVAAFERIISQQDEELKKLCLSFKHEDINSKKIGEIHTLSSVIPLSQQAHAPIFELAASDGIVGGHYSRVAEAEEYFKKIAERFLENIGID